MADPRAQFYWGIGTGCAVAGMMLIVLGPWFLVTTPDDLLGSFLTGAGAGLLLNGAVFVRKALRAWTPIYHAPGYGYRVPPMDRGDP